VILCITFSSKKELFSVKLYFCFYHSLLWKKFRAERWLYILSQDSIFAHANFFPCIYTPYNHVSKRYWFM